MMPGLIWLKISKQRANRRRLAMQDHFQKQTNEQIRILIGQNSNILFCWSRNVQEVIKHTIKECLEYNEQNQNKNEEHLNKVQAQSHSISFGGDLRIYYHLKVQFQVISKNIRTMKQLSLRQRCVKPFNCLISDRIVPAIVHPMMSTCQFLMVKATAIDATHTVNKIQKTC